MRGQAASTTIARLNDVAQRRVSRRTMLRLGGMALGGLALSDLLRFRAAAEIAGAPKHETAVIHVFMGGGPSHIDMVDMKPAAPAEIRGEFKPIATRLPGVQVCEHLPHLAGALDRFAIVRSVSHGNASHLPASHWMMTGYQPASSTNGNVNPYAGAVVAKLRGPNVPGMPAFASIPRRQLLGGAAYLGPAYNPFTTESDPNSPTFSVRNLNLPEGMNVERLDERRALLQNLDRMRRDVERYGELTGVDKFSHQALDLITSPRAQQAFDISREDAATRDRYGRTQAGQGCLLARRLVEAGVTFVTVLSGGEWDTHTNNFTMLRDKSLPPVDRALAALATDLTQRGLDRNVLLLVSGEFGRTPAINAQAGRDHWPGAFSVLFAGGGMHVGQVIGATDAKAAFPTTHPYSPGDVLATVYQFLGIDTQTEFSDHSGRPLRILPEGRPIGELWT